MYTTTKDTSILGQRNDKATSSKWGNDIFSYDINAALKQYDNDLAEYNDPNTTSTRKTVINNKYGGDITAFDKTALYSDYQRDLQFVNYVDALESAKNTALNQAKKDETQKLQYADTRNALMQKYIPETLYAQGIANTGYTADALLKAENKYNQYALNAMNERSAKEENTMQEYQKAFSDFKLEQDEQAYKDFLSREEKRKEEEEKRKEEEDAIQFEIKIKILEWYDYGYINEKGTGMMNGEGAKAHMKLMGATNETINEFIEFYNANEEGANLNPLPTERPQTDSTTPQTDSTTTQTDSTTTKNQNGGGTNVTVSNATTGNAATFTRQKMEGPYTHTGDVDGYIYTGSLVATSSNGNDVMRVDPKFSSFNFKKDGDKGKVEFDGEKFTIAVSDMQPESFSKIARDILGDNYKDHAVFMYNDEIYMVSDGKYSNGEYKVYLMKGTAWLKEQIKNKLKYEYGFNEPTDTSTNTPTDTSTSTDVNTNTDIDTGTDVKDFYALKDGDLYGIGSLNGIIDIMSDPKYSDSISKEAAKEIKEYIEGFTWNPTTEDEAAQQRFEMYNKAIKVGVVNDFDKNLLRQWLIRNYTFTPTNDE